MRSARFLGAACVGATIVAIAVGASPAAAITSAPAWGPIAVSGPTNLPPAGTGAIAVYVQNVGGAPSLGTITVEDELPAGITTAGTATGTGWTCLPAGAGQSTVTCTSTVPVEPGLTAEVINIPVNTGAATLEPETNLVTVSGGGAVAPATYEEPVTVSSTPAKPGIQAYTFRSYNADGSLATQAGSHPYATILAVFVNTLLGPGGKVMPAGDAKTIAVDLPPGFLGNPTATPRCFEGLRDSECPIDTQVGVVKPAASSFASNGSTNGVHSVDAPVGYPAKFTFTIAAEQINVVTSLRSDEDYGVTVESPNTPQIVPVYGAFSVIWGAPGDPSHESQRCTIVNTHSGCGPGAGDTAFLTLPSDCAQQAAQSPVAKLNFDSWQSIGNFEPQDFPLPPVTGCDQLHLAAGFAFQPEKHSAATPSAFSADLTLPQTGLEDPDLLAPPPLKRSEVTLPPGVVLNASAADGLATCSTEQIGLRHPEPPATVFPAPNHIRFDKSPARCPEASKVGSVDVETALLDNPLHGSVYAASQGDNPFGSLLAVYLVVEDPDIGITVKLAGEIRPDPVTGRLTAIFDDAPPAAVENVTLHIRGGNRAPLATPDTCGTATTSGLLAPWSAPESGPATEVGDSFEVNSGPNGGSCPGSKAARPFEPSVAAGTAATAAGTYSPLEFRLTRKDGEQELKGLSITLPPGLTGKFAGIGTCSDAQIAAAEAADGKTGQSAPSCPASSQLGTVSAGAGIGDAPIHVAGKAYLAGPYKGAPISVVAIVPAVAGPFDLGNVVTRTAVYLDPVTAQPTAVTDPIPDILQGVPVELRSLRIDLDRPGFTLTPTSCAKASIDVKMTGAGGDTVSTSDDSSVRASVPFQVGGCGELGFRPRFRAQLHGGTARNAHPGLRTVLTFPPGAGYANIASVQVALPHSEFLDQSHIGTVCTRVQFAAHTCPAGSVYGHVEATTPLLDEPLTGPVYLRSSDNKLPDLVVALHGPPSRPVEVATAGRIDSIHGGIRSTFATIPDAPLSEVVVSIKGGRKGLLVNSRNLCSGRKARMTVRIVGQNGKRADQFPVLRNDCRKGKERRHKNT